MHLVLGSPLSGIRCSTTLPLFTVCSLCQWLACDPASAPAQDTAHPPPLPSTANSGDPTGAARGTRGRGGAGVEGAHTPSAVFPVVFGRFRPESVSAEFGAWTLFADLSVSVRSCLTRPPWRASRQLCELARSLAILRVSVFLRPGLPLGVTAPGSLGCLSYT